ncbi:MAG: SRPBCC domain-containing protein [Actinomycetota bacterium]
MAHDLSTEIDIDAPPARVWAILTDLGAYSAWNPFITESTGVAVVGARLVNRLEPPGGRAMTFRPVVTEVVDERSFEWLGRFGVPRLFDGRHRFDLTPTQRGTRLRHTERFTGLLVPLLRRQLDTSTRAGFEAMNRALAGRAEG